MSLFIAIKKATAKTRCTRIDFIHGNLVLFFVILSEHMRTSTDASRAGGCPCPDEGNRGFTYLALLAAIIIIGISLGAATRYWSNILLRDQEEELLFRGEQYRQAIEKYATAVPGRISLPPTIDSLLQDPRSASKHYLRRKFKDPVSGNDFEVIRDTLTNGIVGVFSPSKKVPLKQANFPDQDKEFEGKKSYNEWRFVYTPPVIMPPDDSGQGSGGPIRRRLFPQKKSSG
jgi:type II secretory pathway pseudopilin PulG